MRARPVWLYFTVLVDDVVSKVKIIRIFDAELFQYSVFVVFLVDKIEVVRWNIHLRSFLTLLFME